MYISDSVLAAGTWGLSSQRNRNVRTAVTKPCAGMAATAQWHAVPACCKGLVPVLGAVYFACSAAPPQPTHRVALTKKPCSICDDATLHAKVGTGQDVQVPCLGELRKEHLVQVRKETNSANDSWAQGGAK